MIGGVAQGLFESFLRESRHTLRILRKNPGFAAAVVLTMAVGIGASAAIFSVVYSVLLKPLAYPEPDQLVRISGGATVAKFEAFGEARSFAGVGAFFVVTENVTLAGVDEPEPLQAARVSTNFLPIIGIKLAHGRSFLAEEATPGTQVAIISGELWLRRFGGDPRVLGGTAMLSGEPFTIIGVLPAGFQFPFPGVDLWRPLQPDAMPAQARGHSPALSVFGRLKPGVNLAEASAEIKVIHRQYALANPGKLDAKPNAISRATPLRDDLVRDVRSTLWMLFGAVGLVLLIACANVAGLLLTRATARSREFAVRAALGASRGRIVKQLLTESLLLAFAGGALGVLVAAWSLRGIASVPGLELPRVDEIRLDGAVLVFAVLLSAGTSLLFGLAPALGASRPDLAAVVKGSSGVKFALGWLSPRSLLVVGQVALSVVLLIGAALLMQSLGGACAVWIRDFAPGISSR